MMDNWIMKHILALGFTAIFLVGCQSQPTNPSIPPLNDQAIIEATAGSSFTWYQKGLSGPTAFNADNTATLTYNGIESGGTWSVKNNMLCTVWDKFRDGKERCSSVYDMGEGNYTHYRDGKLNSKYTKQ